MPNAMSLTSNEIEAANRAEVSAILIRAGYRVYRPEADCYGEDLILRTPDGKLLVAQLKGRPTVDWNKYGGKHISMLFPGPKKGATTFGRKWFLVPHDTFHEWVRARHGHTTKWNDAWSYPHVSTELAVFLHEFEVIPSPAETEEVEGE